MTQQTIYHIGTPAPHGERQKSSVAGRANEKRSYFDDVVSKIETFKSDFDVDQYGELAYDSGTYPLFVVRTKTGMTRSQRF